MTGLYDSVSVLDELSDNLDELLSVLSALVIAHSRHLAELVDGERTSSHHLFEHSVGEDNIGRHALTVGYLPAQQLQRLIKLAVVDGGRVRGARFDSPGATTSRSMTVSDTGRLSNNTSLPRLVTFR